MAISVKNAKPAGQGAKGQTGGAASAPAGNAESIGNTQNTSSLAQPSNQDGSVTSGQIVLPGGGSLAGQSDGQSEAGKSDAQNTDGGALVDPKRDDASDASVHGLYAQTETQCLIVAAKVDGYRRAGRAWSKKPCAIPVMQITEQQAKLLFSDPELVVSAGMVPLDQTTDFV